MPNGFQISEDDIIAAAREHLGIEIGYEEAEIILSRLDQGLVETAALYGNDIETQTVYAMKEIADQMSGFEEFKGPSSGYAP